MECIKQAGHLSSRRRMVEQSYQATNWMSYLNLIIPNFPSRKSATSKYVLFNYQIASVSGDSREIEKLF